MIMNIVPHIKQFLFVSAATLQTLYKGRALSMLLMFGACSCVVIRPPIAYSQVQNPARQLTLEGIEIVGNTKTSANVIIRQLTVRPGDTFSPSEAPVILEANRRRLDKTNFFKDVDVYTRPGSEKGKVVFIIEIKERHWPYFQFEGGRSDLNGWYFVPASLRFDNAFGAGSRFGLKFQIGDRVSKLSLGYHNKIFSDRAFIDVELFGGGQEFVHYFGDEKFTQDVDSGGLRLRLGCTQGLLKHVFIGYRGEDYNPDNFATRDTVELGAGQLPASISDNLEKTKVSALTFGLYTDSRDNPAYPLKGFWGAVTGEVANSDLNSEAGFPKVTLDARFFQRVLNKSVFALHVKGGYTTGDAPFYERFYLGGAHSIRGYDDRRLTPAGWGTKLILTNTEFRFPLSKNNFPYHKTTGVLFFDAGGIWLPGQGVKLDDFFASMGFGIRVKLPVLGTTRFDFAFPLNKVDDNDFKFHISLGHTF